MKIKLLPNHIHASFVDKINDKGEFIEEGFDDFKVSNSNKHQVHGRWMQVVNISDDMDVNYDIGDYIFVDTFRWTMAASFNDQKVWRVDPNGILAFIKQKDVDDFDKFKYILCKENS